MGIARRMDGSGALNIGADPLQANASGAPSSCSARFGSGLVSSAVFGGMVGAVEAMWTDAPAVKAEKTMPALRATWSCVSKNSILFAGIGGTFAATECMAESMRGKRDVWNGVIGGLAAGQIITFKTMSRVRGIGAGLAFAGIAAAVDLSGQRLQPERFADPRQTFNYGHRAER